MTAAADAGWAGFAGAAGAPEAYLSSARALWEAALRATAEVDPARRAEAFAANIGALNPQFAGAWAGAAQALGAPGALGVASSFSAPGGFGAGPAPLGLTRGHQLAWQRLGELSTRAAQQQAQLGAIWSEVVGAALRELGARAGAAIARGEPPASPRALYDQWIECAEAAFASAAHGPAFLKAQAALANTSAELRTQQRELVESWARQLDLPTRAELDAVHRRLRALQAELRGLRASADGSAPRTDRGGATKAPPRTRRRHT